MPDSKEIKTPCRMAGCKETSKGRGLCQRHYDQWRGKIRRELDKERNRNLPFLRFDNPYRKGSGYHIIFETIRLNKPLQTDQLARLAKIELAKAGKGGYRFEYAFEVLRMARHACRRGDYHLRQDAQKRWHLLNNRAMEKEL
jgi:hypothetical protein